MEQLVSLIHSSDIFGIFIENGCSVPVAYNLLNVSGASNTVYLTECPYNQNYGRRIYGYTGNRTVSSEYVSHIAESFYPIIGNTQITGRYINTIYVSSFQIGDMCNITDPKVTHGYIFLQYKNLKTIYHVTIRNPEYQRIDFIDKIGYIGIKLVLNFIYDICPENLYIDMIESEDMEKSYLELLKFHNKKDILCWNSEGRLCRAEDIFRTKNTISIVPYELRNMDLTPSYLLLIRSSHRLEHI